MSTSRFILCCWFVTASTLVVGAAYAEQPRPNFLVILADNVGQDWFDCYGSVERCTPEIDKLAAGGVRFEHCYVTPLCSTTRVEMYTGRYGFRTGWHTHHDSGIYGGGGFDPEREITWARALRESGYRTVIAGKWQINDLSVDTDVLSRHGFDEHLVWTGMLVGEGNSEQRWQASIKPGGNRELESRYWSPVVYRNGEHLTLADRFGPDAFVDYLVDFMSRRNGTPFVAFYSAPLVHVPTVPTPSSPDATTPEREQFAGMVRYLDAQVGRLVAELERLKLRDDTIILFMTDNGTATRLAGNMSGKRSVGGLGTLSEGGLDVPLIVNCPGRVAVGRVSPMLVDCSDVFPTLLEIAGVSVPKGLVIDGRSFAGSLTKQIADAPGRTWIFSQYASTRVVRDRRFKLYSTGAMFDVVNDPRETRDLASANDDETAAARGRLQNVLEQLPPDTKLPFSFRSSSAFQLEEQRKNPGGKRKPSQGS